MRKLALLIAIVPFLCFAADPIDDIIAEVIANNPALAAERTAFIAELTARNAENRLDATEVGFDHTWAAEAGAGTKMSVSVAQSFDWLGAYGARRNALRSARNYAAKRFEASRRALELNARNCVMQVVDANLRCNLLAQVVANVDSVNRQLHKLLELREATALDYRKASLALIDVRQAFVDAEQARAEALNSLAALNGGSLPANVADLCEYPVADILPLEEYLSRGSAEADAARAEAATNALDAKVAKMGLFPGFSVGYIFQREGGMSFNGFSIGLRLPKYSAKSEAEAAQLMAHASRLQAQAADHARNAEITAAYRAAENTAKLLQEYDNAIGADYVELLKQSLAGGQITYLAYFTELTYYVAQRLDNYSRQLRLHTLLTTLQLR